MEKKRYSAKCSMLLADGQRCGRPAYFVTPDGTAPACRDHASAESKFQVMAIYMALLLRALEQQRSPLPPQLHNAKLVDERISLAELVDDIRYIFRKDLDQAERS